MPPWIFFLIWIVIGILIGALADLIWKGERPYGEIADYVVAIVATLITGLLDWYILPLLGFEGTILFIAAVAEPILVALLALWVMRLIKRRKQG
jgi:uncharacterized membrane protein YeaQ/YmgE (transglycosylase-associated protein family)